MSASKLWVCAYPIDPAAVPAVVPAESGELYLLFPQTLPRTSRLRFSLPLLPLTATRAVSFRSGVSPWWVGPARRPW